MAETINISIAKEDAILLNSCLNALQTIMLIGTSDSEDTEKQAKTDVLALKRIQSKIPELN